MRQNKKLAGVWTALVTPMNARGEIDFPTFEKLLLGQKEAGVTGVVPCGTTGESPTLSLTEKQALIEFTLKTLKGSTVQVFAGTGSNSTAESVALSKWASDKGVDGVLVVTPYYNKPSQSGLEKHFLSIADSIDCELMLYNVPGRTGVSLSTDTIVKLAAHPCINSLKEATGNVAFTSDILDRLGSQKLLILSGDDATYLPLLSVGAKGIVSVASNLIPKAMVDLQKSFDAGQLDQALEIHQRYFPILRDLFVESNPVPIKTALSEIGFCELYLRAPLSPLSDGSLKILKNALLKCKIQRGH